MEKIKKMKNDLHALKQILYWGLEVQASYLTMILAEEGPPQPKIEEKK